MLEVAVGGALVSLVQPHAGHERDFHRWYERDHFYAGMLSGPGIFAGRRWVATRDLKSLRRPSHTPLCDDVRAGSFLHTYWVEAGAHETALRWATDRWYTLREGGRIFEHADQIHTAFYAYGGAARREPDGVPPALALDHPFVGLGLVLVDRRADAPPEALETWLRDHHVPTRLPGSGVALGLVFRPLPLLDDAPAKVPRPREAARRELLLTFFDEDPHLAFPAFFDGFGDLLHERGLGELVLAAPFIPTVPGTDTWLDQL